MDIDLVKLNLNQQSLSLLKVIIGLIMFGVSLDLRVDDFKQVFKSPKSLFAGFLSQFIFFPLFTFLLVRFVEIKPSIALGLIMIAACPGGSMSNLMTSLAKGNVALSVGLTSISTLLSMITTPFLLMFIGDKLPGVANLLTQIHVDRGEMLEGVFIILGVPLVIGMLFAHYKPELSKKLQKFMNKFSVIVLAVFIVGALSANFTHFMTYFHTILITVLIHNVLAFSAGLLASKLMRLSFYDTKAVIIEVAVKNSGLGLALVFQFFGGLGGMAMITAWWGISQMVSGLALIQIWKMKETKKVLA